MGSKIGREGGGGAWGELVHMLCPYNLLGLVVKFSALRMEDMGFNLRLHHWMFLDRVIPVA